MDGVDLRRVLACLTTGAPFHSENVRLLALDRKDVDYILTRDRTISSRVHGPIHCFSYKTTQNPPPLRRSLAAVVKRQPEKYLGWLVGEVHAVAAIFDHRVTTLARRDNLNCWIITLKCPTTSGPAGQQLFDKQLSALEAASFCDCSTRDNVMEFTQSTVNAWH
ncbi:hypothetical protein R3P38DRAFT_3227132 [Favolaschia claudopus]|uniref:Uncharacterized protein n=1 Tax=Favolaschia claudopus TaxID=2862362 RepID=A0AAV9ZRZ3_9AGAR